MRKKIKNRIPAALLVIALLFGIAGGFRMVRADEGTLTIRTKQDWLTFAKNCIVDTYSAGLNVELAVNLDLSGEKEALIPVFCGTFDGKGHTIKGIESSVQTDREGLFRVTGPDAVIKNLTISGTAKTEENRTITGILCGDNQGTISDCTIYGTLKSYENVGAAAGNNSGTIEKVKSYAEVCGTMQTGGIAGYNTGTITDCQNYGSVNTEANEAATNTGGIAGDNDGKLTACTNYGTVGYLHTGYNVGGICGINRGFMEACRNEADVSGRRDAGGIAGQMEPSFRVEYGKNAMKLLDNNVSGFSSSLEAAMATIESAVNNGAAGLNDVLWQLSNFAYGFTDNVSWLFSGMTWVGDAQGYIAAIRSEIEAIKDSIPGGTDARAIIEQIEALLDSFHGDDPSAWEEQLQQLMNLLCALAEKIGNIGFIGDHMKNISGYFRALSEVVIGGFQNFGEESTWLLEDTASQISYLHGLISAYLSETGAEIGTVRESVTQALNSLAGLQASVEDVLDGKTTSTEDLSSQISAKENGMIVSSVNMGNVSADYNVGGIIGNLSAELSLNQESDAVPSVDDLLFTDTTLFVRATVYNCDNTGDVDAKYDYTGGTVGYGTRGSVISCENSGTVSAGRNYAGGIGGYFRGTIESCSSIQKLAGESNIGGIAGQGKYIINCVSVPYIRKSGADTGAIAGLLNDGSGNYFVCDSTGGVNGITFADVSKSVSMQELLSWENTSEIFRTLHVRYQVDGETVKDASVSYGDPFPEPPLVVEKDGKYWSWDLPEENNVYYNQTISGSWKNLITTLSSGEDIPRLLVEGEFDDSMKLEVSEFADDTRQKAYQSLPSWMQLMVDVPEPESFRVSVENSDADTVTVRYHAEEDGMLSSVNGEQSTPIAYTRDGKYIVFELPNGGAFTYTKNISSETLAWLLKIRFYLIVAMAVAAVAALIIILILNKTGRTPTGGAEEETSEEENSEASEAEEQEAPEEEKTETPDIVEQGASEEGKTETPEAEEQTSPEEERTETEE